MPSGGDGDFLTQSDFRAAVASLNGDGGQRTQGVCRSYGGGGNLYPGCLLCQMLPQLGENQVSRSLAVRTWFSSSFSSWVM